MGGEVDVLRVTKAERSEGATERERASVTRVGGKRAMSKPRRKGITRVVETEEDGKGNKIAKKRWGRGAYITVKNARGTSAVYTSSTIDRLQREGGGWRCWCWRRLDTALFYLPLKLERVGEEKRPVDGGFRSRHGNANDGLNEALTNRSSPLVSRSLNRPVHRRTLPPYASSGQALRLIDQGWWRVYNGGPVLARQRSKSFFAALFRINYIRLARTTPRAALRFLPTLCERITEYYIPIIEKARERRGWREEYTPLERKWRGTKMLENVICSEIKGKSIRVLLN